MNTEEPSPFVVGDADVDSTNSEILTVQKDKDGDKDDERQTYTDTQRYTFNGSGCMIFHADSEPASIFM